MSNSQQSASFQMSSPPSSPPAQVPEENPAESVPLPQEETPKEETPKEGQPSLAPKKNFSKIWKLGLILAIIPVYFAFIYFMGANTGKVAPSITTPMKMAELLSPTAQEMVTSQMAYPDSAVFDMSHATIEYDGMIIYLEGKVQYTNAYQKEMDQTFQTGFLWSEEKSVPMYIKLGETVLLNNLNRINNQGVCTVNWLTIGGDSFSWGQPVLEDAVSGPDLFHKIDTDLFLSNVPSDTQKIIDTRYDQVKKGMSYGEVCYYLGSEGNLKDIQSEGTSTIKTYIWPFKGMSQKDVVAKMVFQDEILIQKSTLQ